MTNDLVKRLRGWDHCWPARWLEGAVVEAADRIEALERERDELRASRGQAFRFADDTEARLAKTVEALRELVTCVEDGCFCSEMKMAAAISDARAALAEIEKVVDNVNQSE